MKGKKNLNESVKINRLLGKNLRLFRKRTGMSLSQLAEKLSVSPQQLQKYETGDNRISAEKLYKISLVLKVSLGNFYLSNEKFGNKSKNLSEILLDNFSRINSEKVRKHLVENTSLYLELGV